MASRAQLHFVLTSYCSPAREASACALPPPAEHVGRPQSGRALWSPCWSLPLSQGAPTAARGHKIALLDEWWPTRLGGGSGSSPRRPGHRVVRRWRHRGCTWQRGAAHRPTAEGGSRLAELAFLEQRRSAQQPQSGCRSHRETRGAAAAGGQWRRWHGAASAPPRLKAQGADSCQRRAACTGAAAAGAAAASGSSGRCQHASRPG